MKSLKCFQLDCPNCYGNEQSSFEFFLAIYLSAENSLLRFVAYFQLGCFLVSLSFEFFVHCGYYSSVRCISGKYSLPLGGFLLYLIVVLSYREVFQFYEAPVVNYWLYSLYKPGSVQKVLSYTSII